MTIWVPDLSADSRPTYLAVADAIGAAVRLGQLRPGDQLPTHRALADLLGVNVSTITRSYREAARRLLVGGEVGRGTYVLGLASEAALFAFQNRPEGGVIDLSTNRPPVGLSEGDLSDGLAALGPGGRFLNYPSPGDTRLHREAAAAWMERRGLRAEPERVLVCAGAQHAVDTALGLLGEHGDLACEALVYPGLKAVARHSQRRLHPMAMDREGVLPAALEAACRAGLRVAVLSPTLNNPTTATLGLKRREAIVAIARKHDLLLVEEDVYGLLPEEAPPPLAALAPERVLYVTGLSKTVAPGLRLGYLLLPPMLQARAREAEHHTTWYVTALSMALGTAWLEDGTAWRRLAAQRKELAARHRLCAQGLRRLEWRGEPHCPHAWLPSPPGGPERFTRRALQAGVVVVPSDVFAATRAVQELGLRISIGAAPDRATLVQGLARLEAVAEALEDGSG
ncbi:MAG: PLP-dependent aminotransferase family protein [Geothrix sp.]|uniref:aminotransferase-like domain-containing protein n=1 Tax=Geothrix sp. TaxID=1962974 RepID=UPI00185697FB|nr:PLP-dependent aminotransferase family protein [Geothrix sp.]NWJ41344.1 PLP-dependent aminotransferase family protein [Geothrix sp.]WIL20669.1 MAG: PLP-dependent aminotransferase family protein [Geothrix sp.]